MRKSLWFVLILAVGWFVVHGASAAPQPDAEMAAKQAKEAGVKPGEVLGKDNWEQAKDLLPPEILRHYKDGEYVNTIIDWPLGVYHWDPQFKAASETNAGRYTVTPVGTVVDKTSGQQPPFIYGLPFPTIDPADPNAAIKIEWNFQYEYWNEGNSHNMVLLNWVNPSHVDREAVQDVHFLYYDGQGERYRIANPNNLSGQFIAIATSPADLNGTAALTWRYREATKRDSNWVYVPALRRVRAVSPSNRSDGFLGSDMSQDDGPFFDGKPEDFTWKLVGETEVLRLVDAASFAGRPTQVWLPSGGWRSVWPAGVPTVGFQDPSWKGVGWAPVRAALARRPSWIIEAVPKDKYYLYGKIQLYVDKETYQGAWNRKYGWTGELLNTLQVLAYQKEELKRPDGTSEWLWASSMAYQCAENIKMNRATLGGLLPPGKDVPNDRRVPYDPSFFDYNTLQRFGK
ncbi:MAG: outer membrane lipoprotein-sorting protein [Deltaproteobacteria bacterium]|nr:outer membrane lipoprotein-sorting protein [Deltaproteobacteria bacterium]MBI3387096.1 outer membrane lipoprotein-sorting protein [Deltaproteobacteria bacterium]